MNIKQLARDIRNNEDIDSMVLAHNIGDFDALNELPENIINDVQDCLRSQFGNTIKLVHGSDCELMNNMIWNENSSFTSEFDVDFSGEDGFVVEATIPVERIKFYLEEEDEYVISAGALDCTVYTVQEYFGL